ncbi:MAG: ATP-binding protein [Pseudomonadota bacterium]
MQKLNFKTSSTRGLILLVGIISAFLLGCAILTVQVFLQLNDLRATSGERPGYEVAQLEVKHAKLLAAAEALRDGGLADYTEVLRCFSYFDEHVHSLQTDPANETISGDSAAGEALTEIAALLDQMKPLIEGPAQTLSAKQPFLVQALNQMHAPLNHVTDAGLKAAARKSDAVSAALADRLRDLALVATAMIVTMAALTWQLWRLYRRFRKHARNNQANLGRLETILNTSLDAILVVNAEGDILQANPAAAAFFDLLLPDGSHQNVSAVLYRREDENRIDTVSGARLMASCKDGPNRCSKVLIKDRDAAMIPVEMSAARAKQDGRTVTICYLRDVSRRVRAEAEMKQAHDRALASEQAQARFLAMISHEMRTPLTGILGTLDLLDETPLTKEQCEYLEIIQRAAQQLLIQTNDALDLTQAGAGKLSLAREPFSLDDVLDEVLASYQTDADRRGTHLSLWHPEGPLGSALGDRARVLQVLNNLVSNAVKFTTSGDVRIEVSRDPGRTDWVEFQITDTGIGMAEADKDRIFEDFVRLDQARDTEAPGTGLGLGIVRELVTLMQGEVGVESIEGEGSQFRVRLPLSKCLPRSVTAAPDIRRGSEYEPRHILVAEDNATNGFVLSEMLRKDGHDVTCVTCGENAVSEAARQTFDLVLMDVRMPGIDGMLAARQIRESGGLSAKSRLVFLTACIESDVNTLARGLDAEAILTKPLRRAALRDIVAGRMKCPSLAEADGLVPTATTSDPPTAQAATLIDRQHVDQLRDALSPQRFKTLIAQFDKEAAQFFVDLTLWRDRPLDERAQLLHDFAGSAATFGALTLQRRLGEAEEALRRADAVHADDLIDTLPQLWKETRIALKLTPEPV